MSKNKLKISQAMIMAGFTGDIKLFYWAKDGWYAHCDQFQYEWIGQNTKHALETFTTGEMNIFLKGGK